MTEKQVCPVLPYISAELPASTPILQFFIVSNKVLKGKNTAQVLDAELSLRSSELGNKTVTDLAQGAKRHPLLR